MSIDTRPIDDITTAPERTDVLHVEGLTVEYVVDGDTSTAVSSVSFDVGAGERVALVGESGSGKSGTCLAVAGFLTHPDARVSATAMTFGESDLTTRRSPRLPRRTPGIAMVFQDATTSLDPVWTIGSQLIDVVRTTGGVGRRAARARAEELLSRVGLSDTERIMRSRPDQLSGGMRQRAMVALAIASGPRLLIADEPTSALDASLARDVMELLIELTAESGASLLLVTHDIHLCQSYTDRTLVMHSGRIVEEGKSGMLCHTAVHPYTQQLFASVPTLESATLDHLPTATWFDGTPPTEVTTQGPICGHVGLPS